MRRFIKKIKRLIYWIPLLWNSGWWDWEYLIDIMIHQLKYMEDNFKNHGVSGTSVETSKEISGVIKLLDGIVNDIYMSEAYDWNYSKYGGTEFYNNGEFGVSYPDNKTNKTDDEIRDELMNDLEIAESNKSDDLLEALDTMAEKLFGWWD